MIPIVLISSVAIYCLWVTAAGILGWSSTLYNEWRLLEIGLLCFGAIIGIWQNWLPQKKISTLYFILMILLAIGVAASDSIYRSALELTHWCMLIIVCISTAGAIREKPMAADLATWIIALTPLPVVLFTFIKAETSINLNAAHFSNVRALDDYLLALILLLIGLLHRSAWSRYQWIARIAICIYVIALIRDGARAALLATMLAFLYIAWAHFRDKNKIRVHAVILAGFLIIVTTLVFFPDLFNGLFRVTTSGRNELMELAKRYVIDQPLLGIGGQGWGLYRRDSEIYLGILRTDVLHPHNILIQLIVEWGLAGWILSYLIVIGSISLFKTHGIKNPWVVAASLALLINIILSGALIYPHTQIAYLWIIACIVSEISDAKVTMPTGKNYNWQWKIKIGSLLLIFIIIVGWGIRPCQIEKLDVNNSHLTYPRYWDDGRLICFR